MLATRLMSLLSELISANENAFIKGRRITDVIEVAQEFTQSYNCKSMSWSPCITIDFSKAFDTMRWDAIDGVLELLRIYDTFRELVMLYVTTASISTLMEGSPTNIIN